MITSSDYHVNKRAAAVKLAREALGPDELAEHYIETARYIETGQTPDSAATAPAGSILAAWRRVCSVVDKNGALSPESIADRVAYSESEIRSMRLSLEAHAGGERKMRDALRTAERERDNYRAALRSTLDTTTGKQPYDQGGAVGGVAAKRYWLNAQTTTNASAGAAGAEQNGEQTPP